MKCGEKVSTSTPFNKKRWKDSVDLDKFFRIFNVLSALLYEYRGLFIFGQFCIVCARRKLKNGTELMVISKLVAQTVFLNLKAYN